MIARIDRLDALHGALERFWSAVEDRTSPPPQETRMRFDLAVAELAANVCRHAKAAHEVALSVDLILSGQQLDAVIEDNADPAVIPASAGFPEESAQSGRGLEIVRRAVDRISYERTASGMNRWLLTKQLN